jgi:hypothetical protein
MEHYSKRRGREAELNVVSAVKKLPGVLAAERIEQYSIDDQNGRDVRVTLSPDHYPITEVFVQVKSRKDAMNVFRRKFKKKHGIQTADELEQTLRSQRLIILNGQKDEDTIIDVYNQKLKGIIEHAQQTQEIQIFPDPS